ncbi:MAG: anaerobic ribonucleoside-triphosphate reductase [bacterium]|nr:anaerobic ribonucleoside-triphosphate reductase [bacterium]
MAFHSITSVKTIKRDNTIYNLEFIPGESQAVKLCQLDTLLGYNPKGFTLYSNQYLPLWEETSIYDRFKLQGKFDSHTTGGAILHINVQDSKPLSPIQFKTLLEQARTSGTVYFAINLAFSECKNSHYSTGQQEKCPVCQEEIVNQYTRVVGYLSKVSAWNKTRRTHDYPNRHFYTNGKLAVLGKEETENVKEA